MRIRPAEGETSPVSEIRPVLPREEVRRSRHPGKRYDFRTSGKFCRADGGRHSAEAMPQRPPGKIANRPRRQRHCKGERAELRRTPKALRLLQALSRRTSSGCFFLAGCRFGCRALRPSSCGGPEALSPERSTVEPRHGQDQSGHQADGRQDVDTQVVENLSPADRHHARPFIRSIVLVANW